MGTQQIYSVMNDDHAKLCRIIRWLRDVARRAETRGNLSGTGSHPLSFFFRSTIRFLPRSSRPTGRWAPSTKAGSKAEGQAGGGSRMGGRATPRRGASNTASGTSDRVKVFFRIQG